MSVAIDIAKQAGDWPSDLGLKKLIDAATKQTMAHLQLGNIESELSVLLTDDAGIQVLNAQWRNIDKPTNVLSFPIMQLAPKEQPGPMLGDIVLAYETLLKEATEENKELGDHFTHLIVHGLLHLLGYDHEIDNEAVLMEALEKQILENMGIDDPYMFEHSDS